MKPFLDNPIWAALSADNAHLGKGSEWVKSFHPEVAPFAGLKEDTPENFQSLYDAIEGEQVAVLFSPNADLDPSPWNIFVKMPGHQMVFEGVVPDSGETGGVVSLNKEHVPQMLALTQLAQPGPFSERTIDFGGYRGIITDGKLVAMAGRRLSSGNFTEISAVCTHPDHLGMGYARMLINDLIRSISDGGGRPYLHVRADNNRAVELYLRMGFVIRTAMYFYVLKK